MRSSKSRSRSKANRPRTLGNIVNRVFDSSGPEGKVRGTPQQIIEKYQFLARDAQLSNDRVAAENCLQHAEHYTRMLGEAMREMAAEQDQRRQQDSQPRRDDRAEWQGQGNGGNGNGGNGNGGNGGGYGAGRPDQRADQRSDQRPDPRNDQRSEQRNEPRGDYRPDPRDDQRPGPRPDQRPDQREDQRSDYRADPRSVAQRLPADVIDLSDERDGGLVETPEARNEPRPEPARMDPPVADATADAAPKADRAPRRPRGPRKPRADAAEDGPAEPGAQAAE